MGIYQASVRRALSPEQQDLIDHAEHCSADPDRLAAAGAGLGHQVRVARDDTDVALYTVSEVRHETPDVVIRMGRKGRERLDPPDGSDEFDGTVDTVATRSELTDEQAQEADEFVERLHDDGVSAELVLLAPHGGGIEPHTDEQAELVASLLAPAPVSVWLCKGYGPGPGDAFRRWHITSDDTCPGSFPGLATIAGRRFRDAVSFHGFRQDGVLVGGAAPECLREQFAAAIRCAVGGSVPVRVAQPDDPFGGDSPSNIVNRLSRGGGVQLEQSLLARTKHGPAIARAVAGVYAGRLRR